MPPVSPGRYSMRSQWSELDQLSRKDSSFSIQSETTTRLDHYIVYLMLKTTSPFFSDRPVTESFQASVFCQIYTQASHVHKICCFVRLKLCYENLFSSLIYQDIHKITLIILILNKSGRCTCICTYFFKYLYYSS